MPRIFGERFKRSGRMLPVVAADVLVREGPDDEEEEEKDDEEDDDDEKEDEGYSE